MYSNLKSKYTKYDHIIDSITNFRLYYIELVLNYFTLLNLFNFESLSKYHIKTELIE